jgi:hypothetical protein
MWAHWCDSGCSSGHEVAIAAWNGSIKTYLYSMCEQNKEFFSAIFSVLDLKSRQWIEKHCFSDTVWNHPNLIVHADNSLPFRLNARFRVSHRPRLVVKRPVSEAVIILLAPNTCNPGSIISTTTQFWCKMYTRLPDALLQIAMSHHKSMGRKVRKSITNQLTLGFLIAN